MNWTLSKFAAGIAAVGMLGAFSGPAQASCTTPGGGECIYLDLTGESAIGGESATTQNFNYLGFTGTLGTSIYQPSLAVGTTVVDTNIASVLQTYGVTAGSNTYTDGNGTPNAVTLNGTPSLAEVNIDTLGDLSGSTDTSNFNPSAFGSPPQGWGIAFEYYLEGVVASAGGNPVANYTSGYFDVYFDDYATTGTFDTQILRANISSSALTGTALELTGTVSYDWDGSPGDDCTAGSLCAQFFNFADTDTPFFEQGSTITFTLDTTVVPASPTADQLGQTSGTGTQTGNSFLVRQTNLNGVASFGIPEPGTLALLGIGLLGAARLRRQA